MRRPLKLRNHKISGSNEPQRGYMLITLMLFLALLAVAALAVLPEMGQQIRRDREEEMCHRGTQYMRAIQRFYKKVGRFPTSVEELEKTNNIRFLRKRYKDPLNRDPQTGKERDFKLLHMQDVNLNNGPVMPGATMLGQNGLTGAPNALQGALGQMQQLAQGQQLGGLQQGQAPGQNNNGDDQSGAGNSGAGNSPNSAANPGSSSSSPFSSSSSSSTGSSGSGGFGGQVMGGGPILGVASTSKAKTIREYNKKTKYNDWLFIYDPTSDRGGLLVGPWQTPTTSTMPGASPIGQPLGNQPGQGFGQSSPFGQGGMQPNNGQFSNSPGQTQGQNPPQQ